MTAKKKTVQERIDDSRARRPTLADLEAWEKALALYPAGNGERVKYEAIIALPFL